MYRERNFMQLNVKTGLDKRLVEEYLANNCDRDHHIQIFILCNLMNVIKLKIKVEPEFEGGSSPRFQRIKPKTALNNLFFAHYITFLHYFMSLCSHPHNYC